MQPDLAAGSSSGSSNDSSKMHHIAKLLKLVENRKCADCSAGLGDLRETYAQVKFGVWICKKCAMVHNRFVNGDTLMPALSRTWTDKSYEVMACAGSNVKQNLVLERYSNGLTKPTSATADSGDDELQRELWIRCKYARLFSIPAMSEKQQRARLAAQRPVKPPRVNAAASAASGTAKSASPLAEVAEEAPKKVLPMRLVDYFMTLGPGVCVPTRRPHRETKSKFTVLESGEQEATLSLSTASPLVAEELTELMLPALPERCDDVYLPAIITDCFPSASMYADTEVPEEAAPFIFPLGLGLSGEEKPPFISTFVLTDSKRVKIHGAALIFYELIEPEELAVLLTPKIPAQAAKKGVKSTFVAHEEFNIRSDYDYEKALAQRLREIRSKHGWHLVYVPQAIALTGHYAFYNAFTEFLEDIYRASLSSAPVPLERFINNFVVETPLPPMGRTEVCVALPSKTLSISRPALNQLPMVDFSFRPLFACLSVDNIITTFRMICGEYSLCFVSKNIALLTPVQEAMLTLLFPLVWQGVYIPVLPKHMMEILDAPVPIITGIHKSYFANVPESRRPSEVLFIDIDNDTIQLGGTMLTTHPFAALSKEIDTRGFNDARNGIISYLQEPLPKMFVKLRAKMVEFGGCIYRTPTALALLETAGLPYPKQEHLTPLTVFAMNAGLASRESSKKQVGRFTGQAASYSFGDRDTDTDGLGSILSSDNNCTTKKWDKADNFDAAELRSAFLRFFVALFIDCDKRQKELDQVINAGTRGSTERASSASSRLSIFGGNSNSAQSLSTRLEAFYVHLLQTQMYSEFKDERTYNADMPEIRYFEESIAEKLNRSYFTMTTKSTPFLDSKADDITQTYTPPTPNVSGLKVGQTFEYSKWPRLSSENVGPTRPARVLLTGGAEMFRKANKLSIHNSSYLMLEYVQWGMAGRKGQPGASAAAAQTSAATADPAAEAGAGAGTQQLQAILDESAEQFKKVSAAITRMQAKVRMRRLRKRWRILLRSVVRIQSVYRSHVSARKVGGMRVLAALKFQIAHIVRIQAVLRGFVAYRAFGKLRRAVIRLQAVVRAGDQWQWYCQMRLRFQQLTGLIRGHLTRRRDRRRRESLFSTYRAQLLLLWNLEQTTLHYRSIFWVMVRLPTYLHLAIIRDELYRLYGSIGLLEAVRSVLGLSTPEERESKFRRSDWQPPPMPLNPTPPQPAFLPRGGRSSGRNFPSMVYSTESDDQEGPIDATNSCRLISAISNTAAWRLIESQGGVSTGSDELAGQLGTNFKRRYKAGEERIKAERNVLYKAMKTSISATDLEGYYKSFGISVNSKKKKDAVVFHLVFTTNTAKQVIDTSALLLLHVHHGKDGRGEAAAAVKPRSSSYFGGSGMYSGQEGDHEDEFSPTGISTSKGKLDEWFQKKKGDRIRAASLETLHACLKLVASAKSTLLHSEKVRSVDKVRPTRSGKKY